APPVMCGYQAAGAAPFVLGHPIPQPETVATAIRIGNPQSWDKARDAQKQSEGWFDKFSDEEILQAQRLLAEREGVFCEPASAIALAGAMRDIESGKIPPGKCVVCTLTGHGLKDPDIAVKQSTAPLLKIKPVLAEVKKAILEHLA
ncbi:MAG: pyridoxal-phosphate dependent enzyme, partial [Acidiferrobacterales bacterium]|nr:pyridoxal-phosphate dependent enzyme [Acidiferrobacterales bacterium]